MSRACPRRLQSSRFRLPRSRAARAMLSPSPIAMVLAALLLGGGCGGDDQADRAAQIGAGGRPGAQPGGHVGTQLGGQDSTAAQASAGQHAPPGAQGQPARPGGPGGFAGHRAPGTPAGDHPPQPTIPVAIASAAEGSIASYYSGTATLEPEKQATVLARVSGLVLRLEAEEGDWVDAGATLLAIEDAEYRHRLKQTEAQAALQQTRFKRLSEMFERDLASAEEFETARSDLQAAEAARDLAALELSYTQVPAPFAGRVTQRVVDPGQMVNAGTHLFTIADTEPLLARVHVPAKEFRQIHTDQPVELILDSTKERLRGLITLISPIIDPTSGTIKVTVEITDYPPSTRPGDFAAVRVVTDRHQRAVLVPKIAVFSDKGQDVAFVVVRKTAEQGGADPRMDDSGMAERRLVETGFQDEAHIEILSGIAVGEQVVIQGQRSLEDGQPVRIAPPVGGVSQQQRDEDS